MHEDLDPKCVARHTGVWLLDSLWAEQRWTLWQEGGTQAILAAQRIPEAAMQPQNYSLMNNGVAIVRIADNMQKGFSKLGGTNTIDVRRQLRNAAADSEAKAILLAIDSPGGNVDGTFELAAEIRKTDKIKPIFSYIEDLGASAAYWAASQTRAIFANADFARVGSIGAYAVVRDTSGAAEKAGIKVEVISSGPYKGLNTEGMPATDLMREEIQGRVDDYMRAFAGAVVSGRKLTAAQLKAVTNGKSFKAGEALGLGLIDSISTFDEVIAQIVDSIPVKGAPKRQAAALALALANKA